MSEELKNKVYKLVRKDGLFSGGSLRPRFSDRGKLWTTLGHIIQHINLICNHRDKYSAYKFVPDDWEIVEYELVEVKRIKASTLTKKCLSEDQYKIKKLLT